MSARALSRSPLTPRSTPRLGAVIALAALAGCGSDPQAAPDATDTGVAGDAADTQDTAAEVTSDPGALVKTTATGKVGVLLDELPTAMRDRVATALIAKPTAFWEARAQAQLALTHYRLTFRAYYYDESENKGSLHLPPPSALRFTFDAAGPKRVTVGTHDYVAVDYVMDSMIVAEADSPPKSDPALATIGASVEETFTLPIDPELVLQRSGYACMDEAEFPPRSVDGESVATYFDDTCVADESEITELKSRCHQTVTVTEDCPAALERTIGAVSTTIQFERVAYDAAKAAPFRVGEWTSTDSVDVQPVAEALDTQYVVYKYIPADDCAVVEKCVGAPGWRRLLRFDAFLKNTGQVDMTIGDVDYFIASTAGDTTLLGRHNIFEYSACHDHYHFSHYGEFNLDPAGGGDTLVGSKRAFCLETGTRHFNDEHTPMTTAFSGCHYQGLTHGWGDEYGASLDCQWFDITDVDTSAGSVSADLIFKANPDGFLCEGNPVLDAHGDMTFEPTDFKTESGEPVDRPVCEYGPNWQANNEGKRPATLPKSGGLVTGACTRGQLGPLRDCGFAEGAKEACTAGANVTLRCTTSAAEPQVVRVCEASEVLRTGVACVFRDALANQITAAGAPVDVTFACPGKRSDLEPGGSYALYGAPVIDGDPAGPITCTAK